MRSTDTCLGSARHQLFRRLPTTLIGIQYVTHTEVKRNGVKNFIP